MTDTEAKILDECSLVDYMSIFDASPKKCAVSANDILRELSLSEWKRLTREEVFLRLRLIEKYRAKDLAKLSDVLSEKAEAQQGLEAVNRQKFNDYVCAVFAAAGMPINKTISMLDFLSIKKNIK